LFSKAWLFEQSLEQQSVNFVTAHDRVLNDFLWEDFELVAVVVSCNVTNISSRLRIITSVASSELVSQLHQSRAGLVADSPEGPSVKRPTLGCPDSRPAGSFEESTIDLETSVWCDHGAQRTKVRMARNEHRAGRNESGAQEIPYRRV
jgi:hypothetical protein